MPLKKINYLPRDLEVFVEVRTRLISDLCAQVNIATHKLQTSVRCSVITDLKHKYGSVRAL